MNIRPGEKIDWFMVIAELCNFHDQTIKNIAIAIATPQSTVQGWKLGATPKYEDGERLIGLWEQITKKSRESVYRVKLHS